MAETDGRNLRLRIASALVLAPLAIAIAYAGGWPFVLLWCAAAIGILWEWTRLVDRTRSAAPFASGSAGLFAAAGCLGLGLAGFAVAAIVLGAIGAAVAARAGTRGWMAGGMLYAGVLLLAASLIRADAQAGFAAVILLFAVVWGTDILGYFAGRAIGGPKLAPSISPKKTWSGAIAGALFALAAGIAMATWGSRGNALYLGTTAVLLSVASQAGDLFESRVKRLFDAKDSSALIPGHGGLMDRLDGFVAAAGAALLIGLLRGGLDAPAQGLMGW